MRLSTRLAVVTAASFLGLLLLAGIGLHAIKNTLETEKRDQIVRLLKMSNGLLGAYAKLEASGKLSRADAQQQAAKALDAMKADDVYFFGRDANDVVKFHTKKELVGKVDKGSKMPDGRFTTELYHEAVQQEQYALVTIQTTRKGEKVPLPKLNGVYEFKPWGWIVGIGFFIDDIQAIFWRNAIVMLAVGLVTIVVVTLLTRVIGRSIIKSLGGEPQYATDVVQAIAAGDLTQIVHVSANSKASSLLGCMKAMQDNLSGMINSIRSASQDIVTASKTLDQQMLHLKRVSEKASESTSSAAAAIEELSVSIDHVTATTKDTETMASQAAGFAREGEMLAKEATEHIQGVATEVDRIHSQVDLLSDRTRHINGIAETIREIANQTNLLALNAAIEAARAGETGRGFAVVADEVRKLAERTTLATDEIGNIVKAVVEETSQVSSYVQNIGPMVWRVPTR